jgi:hypothetical protein
MVLVLALPTVADARRGQSLQEVPVAVSAFSGESLESLGQTDMADAIKSYSIVPSYQGSASGIHSPTHIRGVQSGVQSIRTLAMLDGMPIEQVEILRGPQGTLFGSRASSASIIRGVDSNGNAVINIRKPFDTNSNPNYLSDRKLADRFIEDNTTKWLYPSAISYPYTNAYENFRKDYSNNLTWEEVTRWLNEQEEGTLTFTFYTKEGNKIVIQMQDSYPNDPLYPREGQGKTDTARKVLGSLLSVIDAPVAVSKDMAKAQWGLPETGFHRRGKGQSAWDLATGEEKNVIVAVIDSGLDLKHKDRPQYVWTNADEIPDNGIDDDYNGYVDDVHGWNFYSETNDITDNGGHGTFVAGIIAAKTNNGEGIAGINPGAQIMPLKVLNKDGETRILAVYRAIRYAVDNGARVLNLSLGGKGKGITRLEQLGINYAHAMGCIVVVAAGNQGKDITRYGPPGARRAFSVASMDMDGKPRQASNRGLNVAVTAPGQSIYSLAATDGNRNGKFMPYIVGDYFRSNGTSFAAPFVSGAASLIWSKYPNLSNRVVEDMILQSATDVHDTGWDAYSGYGLLNGYGALKQNPNELLVPRITEVYVNQEKRRIHSVDLYGVVRGNLDHYTVWVGRGKNPSKWQQVQGPVKTPVEYRLIGRIDGAYFKKGSKWTVRLDAVDRQQRTKRIQVLVAKDKG